MSRGASIWIAIAAVGLLAGCSGGQPAETQPPDPAGPFCDRLSEGASEYRDFLEWTLQGGHGKDRFDSNALFVGDLGDLAPEDLIDTVDTYAIPIETMTDDYANGSTPIFEASGFYDAEQALVSYCLDYYETQE